MDLKQAFGQVLKDYRLKSGLSQEKLAELCDLDRTYISMLERGKRQPTLGTIFELANVLVQNPEDLIFDTRSRLKPFIRES